MNRKIFASSVIFLIVVLTIAGAALQVVAQSTDADRERASALWDESIRAKGGHERLQSIQTFLISSTIDVRAPRGGSVKQTERLYVMPRKAWIYTFTPEFDVKVDATVINFERSFCAVTLSPARGGVPELSMCLPTTPLQFLVQEPVIYLMETKWVRPVPMRVRIDGKGKNQVEVIETEVGKLHVDFYLDRKTKLPTKLVTEWYGGIGQATGASGLMTVELEDYGAINGIMMPKQVTRVLQIKGGIGVEGWRRDIERARYQFDVAYNSAVFEGPAPKKVKSDDWKSAKGN